MNQWKPLENNFPLPEGTSILDRFDDVLEEDSPSLHLAGISAQRSDGKVLTGSAVDRTPEQARVRAYFELLERVAIFEAEDRGPNHEFDILDRQGRPTGQKAKLPPLSQIHPTWRWSRSNGIAAHTNAVQAIHSAEYELLERDHILRSWFCSLKPRPAVQPLEIVTWGGYCFETFEFTPENQAISVSGVFGFHPDLNQSVVFGFGAGRSPQESTHKAQKEALQRMAFLWGEPLPETNTPLDGSPDFHLDWFRRPHQRQRIERWLSGNAPDLSIKNLPHYPHPLSHEGYIDLSMPHLAHRVTVVQAVAPDKMQLFFGFDSEWLTDRGADPDAWIHPIA